MNWLLLNLCDSHLYFYSTIWRKNCSLVTLSLSPSVHIFLPMNYWIKRDVYISMCPINVNCVQLCIICILLLVYILYICIYMCDLLFQEAWSMKNRKAINIYEQWTIMKVNIYEQWTIMKVIIYFICLRSAPPDEFLIAVNICWQQKKWRCECQGCLPGVGRDCCWEPEELRQLDVVFQRPVVVQTRGGQRAYPWRWGKLTLIEQKFFFRPGPKNQSIYSKA